MQTDSYLINSRSLFEGLFLNPTDFMITKKLENNYIELTNEGIHNTE